MKPGTPGFVGDRLREAREARGMSGADLAPILGVSPQSVSQYESGRQTPAPAMMRRLAEVLDLPFHFFVAPATRPETDVLFYRSLDSATKKIRARMERRFSWLRELVAYLRRFVKFHPVNFPTLDLPGDPASLGNDRIEAAAKALRSHWGLNNRPISNLVWLMENNGAIVSRHHLDSEKLDAFSQWNSLESSPYFVIGADKLSAVRSRYNVAHELGHLILHRRVSKEQLGHKPTFKLVESQAHRFAGAFILPDDSFAQDLWRGPSLDLFVALKQKWGASIQFMAVRCRDLGIIDDKQLQRFMININQRGWRTREPFDDKIEFEQPRFLRRAVEILIENRVIAPSEIPFQLRLAAKDIEDLAGLDPGYFKRAAAARSIDVSLKSDVPADADDEGDGGEILRFPGSR